MFVATSLSLLSCALSRGAPPASARAVANVAKAEARPRTAPRAAAPRFATAARAAATALGEPDGAERPRPVARPRAFTTLDVPGFDPAVVSFPRTATLPQPVLISTHGAGDTPQEMCELWRGLLGDRGVVLCPAGPRMRAHEEGRYYPDHHFLEQVTFAAVRALAREYPDGADTTHIVYTGYSQGATMGALMIPSHGAECPRLVLVEGGFDDWSVQSARVFENEGGARVLFVCGRRRCKDAAESSAARLRGAGVEARVVSHVGEGHVIRVAEAAAPVLDWLLEGDPRWSVHDTAP